MLFSRWQFRQKQLRILPSEESGLSVHTLLIPSSRPSTYTKWNDAHVQAACDGVQSIRRAAMTYNIPKSMLYDRITGRVTGNKPGLPPSLSAKEEDEMVSFLEGCASMGYARSKKQVSS